MVIREPIAPFGNFGWLILRIGEPGGGGGTSAPTAPPQHATPRPGGHVGRGQSVRRRPASANGSAVESAPIAGRDGPVEPEEVGRTQRSRSGLGLFLGARSRPAEQVHARRTVTASCGQSRGVLPTTGPQAARGCPGGSQLTALRDSAGGPGSRGSFRRGCGTRQTGAVRGAAAGGRAAAGRGPPGGGPSRSRCSLRPGSGDGA